MDDRTIELSGFHAVKHALRFDARGLRAWTDDRVRVTALCARLAPDVLGRLESVLTEVTGEELAGLTDYRHPTRLIGRADRPAYRPDQVAAELHRPLVHLDRPVDPGNVGAVVRVAAAVGAAAVTTTEFTQLWAPACLRGSAGLHFALPVLDGDLEEVATGRSIVAFDPGGEPFRPAEIGPGVALVFGAERDGLSPTVRDRADRLVRLPMREGVSSLNLATSVAAATYAVAFGG